MDGRTLRTGLRLGNRHVHALVSGDVSRRASRVARRRAAGLLPFLIAVLLLIAGSVPAGDDLPAHRLSRLTAFPVKTLLNGPMTLDGKLDEWKPEAFVTIMADPARRDQRAARIAMAWDDAGLYVLMDVLDDTPMQNEIDPLADAFRGWRGDAVQMRFIAGKEISHWTWWYYTKGRQPAVDVRYGTEFTDPVTRVGAESKLAYRQKEGGYSLELLIPWPLLKDKGKPGAVWKAVVEPHWGVFGTEVTRFADCIVREEGAVYKRQNIWGELHFAGADNAARLLAEQQANEARRDRIGRQVVPTWGVPIRLKLPATGYLSAAIVAAEGRSVRTLLARAKRDQGETLEYWDGLDDDGNAVPAGNYAVKALTHPGITPKFVTSVMNSGNPPWITADGKGSWGADHGGPLAAAAGPDGWTFLLWSGCEAGFDLIAVDGEGQKQWGARIPFGRHGLAMVYDEGSVLVAEAEGLLRFNARTGAAMAFADGQSTWPTSKWQDAGRNVAGLADSPDAVFVALSAPGKILALDKKTLLPRAGWELAGAGGLAYDAKHKRLYALAGGKVWMLDPAAVALPKPFLNELDAPAGIAVDADSNVYVAQQGRQMNVAVFDSAGKRLRSIGKAGGRPAVGKFDAAGMLQPAGIAIDSLGRLWVPESDHLLRRISLWDTRKAKLLREFFGGAAYAVMMAPDPDNPEQVYLHNSRFIVDYEKGTWRPDATVYRKGWRGAAMSGSEAGYGFMGATFTISTYQGKKFAMNGRGGIFAWGENEFTPLVQVEGEGSNIFQFGGTLFPGAGMIRGTWNRVDSWRLFRPQGLSKAGAPIYPKAEAAPKLITGNGPMRKYSNWMDVWPSYESDWQEFYAIASLPDTKHGGIPDGGGGDGLFRFNRDGEIQWRYPNMKVFYAIKDQRLAGPGDLMGAVRILGLASMPKEKGGEIVGVGCYRGYFGLISGDGLFIDKVSDDKGKGLKPGFDTFFIENFSGYLFKHPKTDKVYLFCGDVDGRILELQGLDQIKCFAGPQIKLSPTEVKRLAAARKQAASELPAAVTDLSVARVKAAPTADARTFPAAAMRTMKLDDTQTASVGLACDDENLYAMFRVDDPSPWQNKTSDWKLLFKGGDAVDLQLGTQNGQVRVFVAPGAKDGTWMVVGMWTNPSKDLAGEPHTYKSPVGQVSFPLVARIEPAKVDLKRGEAGYSLVLTMPWKALGLIPAAVTSGDLGVLFSDQSGTRTVRRCYLFNNETNIVDDIPSEARLKPQNWGQVRFGGGD